MAPDGLTEHDIMRRRHSGCAIKMPPPCWINNAHLHATQESINVPAYTHDRRTFSTVRVVVVFIAYMAAFALNVPITFRTRAMNLRNRQAIGALCRYLTENVQQPIGQFTVDNLRAHIVAATCHPVGRNVSRAYDYVESVRARDSRHGSTTRGPIFLDDTRSFTLTMPIMVPTTGTMRR
jgi:hypothetical protein